MSKQAKKYLTELYNSLSFKLFLILLLLIILLFGLYSTIFSILQKDILENAVGLSAYRVSDVVKNSLYWFMLRDEREELYYTVMLIGKQPGIESVHIYNKKGEIKFSTKETETDQVVDMREEACYVCHSRDKPIQSLPPGKKRRIFYTADGRRIMELVNPIRNAQECSNPLCHAHSTDQTILGVLTVQMSLEELDKAVSQTQLTTITLSIGSTFLAIILFAIAVYLIIHRPITTLQIGTERLSTGDLDYRIKTERNDELGMLAGSFNNMAENLREAYNELKDWSDKLEKRVKEKTEELEQMHRGMLQVEKMASLGKMAATVAHELNNPIAGIVTYAKLLQKRISKNYSDNSNKDKVLKELELIRSESMRCGNIVSNLLAFTRRDKLNFQEWKLKEIIERTLGIVRHHIELAGIEVESHVEIKPEEITCDPNQLIQAFVALLVNAVEAMPEGGRLAVIAQNKADEADKILIRISDTGIGIPDEVKSKIFEPFFSTKKDKKGVGLGLVVVYGIVQRHNGKIWVESRAGQGTTFFIELPIKHPKVERNVQ